MAAPDLPITLSIELLSDTTFSCGEGTAGIVDVEVDHDELGLPRIGGKVVHGLLRDAWLSMARQFPSTLAAAAPRVLGPIADLTETSILRVGDASLPDDVRQWARFAVERKDHPLSPEQVLSTLTDIRRQTAQSRVTGSPEATTLRSSRVVLRMLRFESALTWLKPPGINELSVLALSALGVRHGGLGRNRGRGFLRVTLNNDHIKTQRWARWLGVSK